MLEWLAFDNAKTRYRFGSGYIASRRTLARDSYSIDNLDLKRVKSNAITEFSDIYD